MGKLQEQLTDCVRETDFSSGWELNQLAKHSSYLQLTFKQLLREKKIMAIITLKIPLGYIPIEGLPMTEEPKLTAGATVWSACPGTDGMQHWGFHRKKRTWFQEGGAIRSSCCQPTVCRETVSEHSAHSFTVPPGPLTWSAASWGLHWSPWAIYWP